MRTNNATLSLWFIILITAWSCNGPKQDKKSVGTDLMKYGIPVSVMVPENSEITKGKTGRTSDVYIKNDSGYNMHILMADARSGSVSSIVTERKKDIISSPDFIKIIEEYPDGFYYEKYGSDGNTGYDFFLVQIIGEKEVHFQGGLAVNFSEVVVKQMIKSIRKN